MLRGLFEDLTEASMRSLMEEVENKFNAPHTNLRVCSTALPAAFSEVLPRHRIVMAVEAAKFHRERLQKHPQDYLPRVRGLLEEGLSCPATEYGECKEHQQQLTEQMRGAFHRNKVDFLLCPATRGSAPDVSTTGDPAFNSPWSYIGFPSISIPAGFAPDGMPLAIQLVGRPWEEDRLFAVAAWCEKILGINPGEPPCR
jgi:aspartyl-tRNA(Asn)/glutamyl-tRNA(Gln) amidotransferase subunit A